MREGRIIQLQSKGFWSEEEPTKSRAETALELHAGPAFRAGHQRTTKGLWNTSRTYRKTLIPQELPDLEYSVMWLVFGGSLGRAGNYQGQGLWSIEITCVSSIRGSCMCSWLHHAKGQTELTGGILVR